MIKVESLTKHYRVAQRAPGWKAALRSIFHREYKTVKAVQDLSFSIQPGERVGFLGPNGAGKTTTLKMLAGLLHPSSGSATVFGHTPAKRDPDFLRTITLVMGQKQQLMWDLPPSETFLLNRAVYDVPKDEFDKTYAELSELLHLEEVSKKPTRQLSLGERMRCELAAALLHRPQVLFLDEPTIGLDVEMQLTVREFIRKYNERTGATVLLTSHYMGDVLALCPRVLVIDGGVLQYDGDLPALVKSVRPNKRVTARHNGALSREEAEKLGRVIEYSTDRVSLDVEQTSLKETATFLLSIEGVSDMTMEDPPLEEAMRAMFKRGS